MIFAQSAAIDFLVNRPSGISKKGRMLNRGVLIDNRVVNWTFLSFGIRFAMSMALVLGLDAGWNNISLFEEFWYLGPLVIVVLFLNSWVHLRRYLEHSSLAMIGAGVTLVLLSFGLSKWEVNSYESLETYVAMTSVTYEHPIALPVSELGENLGGKGGFRRHKNLFVSKNNKGDIVYFDRDRVEITSLYDFYTKSKDGTRPRNITIVADKDLTLADINRYGLDALVQRRLALTFAEGKFSRPLQSGYSIYLPPCCNTASLYERDGVPPPPLPLGRNCDDKGFFANSTVIEIHLSENGNISINDKPIDSKDIDSLLNELITEPTEDIVLFRYEEAVSIEKYVEAIAPVRHYYKEKREALALSLYGKEYFWLNREKQREIRDVIPMRISMWCE